MTAVAPPSIDNEAYQLGLNDKSLVSFPAMWVSVAETCTSVFMAFENRVPDDELPQLYNELNAKMCRAHALVYRLTAFECADCPALVRGVNAARVVGSQPESTQVLVVYYLLRELLKKQLAETKKRILQSPDRIDGYLRGFEKFTAGVNFVKSAFTYLHWAWQKRGLPAEHIILPTEIVALALWCEHMLDREMKETLKNKVGEVLRAFQQGYAVDVNSMENVKRLSLSLLLLNDPHQLLHAAIVEEPYISMVVARFAVEKRRYKLRGPEEYIRTCYEELQQEELKAKCFLAQTSYAKVHQRLVETLVTEEADYLKSAASDWFNAENNHEARRSLTILYELLGNGTAKSWMEQAVESYVVSVFKLQGSTETHVGQQEPAYTMLLSLKKTHNTCRRFVVETFGNMEPLLKALEDGLNTCLASRSDIAAPVVADWLAVLAAEEVLAGTVFVGPEGHWVADVYKLLAEKEVFSRRYVALLRSRLLSHRFVTDGKASQLMQTERTMVTRLFMKGTNFDFVTWCREMLHDVLVSSVQYQQLGRQVNANISVFPIVLQRFYWASLLSARPDMGTSVPADLFPLVRSFRESFASQKVAPGHLLSLQKNFSVVMVRYTFGSSNVRLILPLNEYAVVSPFTTKSEWRADTLASKLATDQASLNHRLKQFVSFGLMTVGDTIKLVPYTGTENCLNFVTDVTSTMKTASKGQTSAVYVADENNSFSEPALQAFVAKVLKSEGAMKLDALFDHIQRHEKGRAVQRRELKRCIEKLLQGGFVTRDADTDSFVFAP